MCYSAQVIADYRDFKRFTGAKMDIDSFVRLFWVPEHPDQSPYEDRPKFPRALELAFRHGTSPDEKRIAARLAEFDAAAITATEQEFFKQQARVVAAQRIVDSAKPTKKATEDVRIGTDKVSKAKQKLADLKRTEMKPKDSRIFPGWYAPIMVMEGGERVIKPMRYQCRPAGKPAFYDREYPGTYNARRDNLEKFWKGQFGHTHAIMLVTAFYENVSRHAMEGRELAAGEKEENVILEFRPQPEQLMYIACLYSHWTSKDEDLWSFAAITDEPPPEVAAAGHDRCIIQLKPENVDAWLNPDPANLSALQTILDDRPRPYYEHRMAA